MCEARTVWCETTQTNNQLSSHTTFFIVVPHQTQVMCETRYEVDLYEK